jgi:hypothetical protein
MEADDKIEGIINASTVNFIPWVSKTFHPGTPSIRRVFSLMRILPCETIFYSVSSFYKECSHDVHDDCGENRQSCADYIVNLKHYGYILKDKYCYKFLFFSSAFEENGLVDQADDDLLGFCIIHKDHFHDYKGRPAIRSHVTKAIIKTPFISNDFYMLGTMNDSVKAKGKTFSIVGNYFCEQNNITNSCTHAALKMATKWVYPNITAEEINIAIGKDHLVKKGNEGISREMICMAIKDITKKEICFIRSFDFDSPIYFLKTIYHAIESRFPVIFNFSINAEGNKGHAIAMLGHTFNNHNWWSYSLKDYFSYKYKELNYLPSFLWCDNFIVHDDQIGPYYLLPIRFVIPYSVSDRIHLFLKNLSKRVNKLLDIDLSRKYAKTSAILIHPKGNINFKDVLSIERYAMRALTRYASIMKTYKDATKKINDYFMDFYDEGKLILRTFLITKSQYLNSINHKDFSECKEQLLNLLPDIFWITEMSIPELFWINRQKLGEIITDPSLFERSENSGAVFIRLIDTIGFIGKKGIDRIDFLTQNKYYPLLGADGSIWHI